jgi:hypothetical protein
MASSDFELKLVVKVVGGIAMVVRTAPEDGESSSMKIGEVTPKLPSAKSLFQTLLVVLRDGKRPLFVAVPVPQAAVEGQLGGNGSPIMTVDATPA